MRFEHSTIVNATQEVVFALTQNYSARLKWDPFLREAALLDGATEPGFGVRAWCVARSGVGMETEYVSFTPPRVAAVKMTRGPKVLETFGGAWEFAPVDGGRTRVTFRYQLRTRPRWLAWLMEPVARWWFSYETRMRVIALGKALAGRDR
jgi:ribosome-associated toxin RatA of RatAB toxin-antitoxin module